MRASVVIPVKDDPPVFRCVASVIAGAGAQQVEVIVVDNGSEASFRQTLEALPPPVCVLDEPQPGPAAARNRGIRAARGEAILFIDSDCVAHLGWIAAALEGLGATGADIVRGAAGAMDVTAESRLIEASFRGRRRWPAGKTVNADTKNLAVRRRVFEQIEFNPRLLRGEDIEFGRLAAALGFRTAFWPEMRVDHEHEATLAVFLAKRVCGGWTSERADDRLRALPNGTPRGRRLAALGARIPGAHVRALLCQALLAAYRASGWAVAAAAPWMPERLGGVLVGILSALGFAVGGFLYRAGYEQPAFRDIAAGRLPRSGEPRRPRPVHEPLRGPSP